MRICSFRWVCPNLRGAHQKEAPPLPCALQVPASICFIQLNAAERKARLWLIEMQAVGSRRGVDGWMTTINRIIISSLSLAACKEVDTNLPLESQE